MSGLQTDEKRIIVLDTETTGIASHNEDGSINDRIIEIGAVELIGRNPTGRKYHVYIDPEREVEEGAEAVHGLSWQDVRKLSKGKKFKDIVGGFLDFVGDSEIMAHHAPFDIGFLNAELQHSGLPTITQMGNPVSCTLKLANQIFPGQRNNLNQMCKRFGIDLSKRKKEGHGALLDAELLVQVFLLMTQNQISFINSDRPKLNLTTELNIDRIPENKSSKLKVVLASDSERQSHNNLVKRIKKESGGDLSAFEF